MAERRLKPFYKAVALSLIKLLAAFPAVYKVLV